MPLSSERFEKIRSTLPEPVWDRQARLETLGLPPDVISKLVISPRAPLFDRLVREINVRPMLAGEVLTRHATALRRKGFDLGALTDEEIAEVLRLYQQAELAREGIVPVLQALSRSGPMGESDSAVERVRAAMQELGLRAISWEELKTAVARAMREFDPSAMHNPDKKHDYLMGVLMKQLRGRAEGRRIAEHLDAELGAATGV
jgi:glutamyl-tRNA(Gln) amidotransferase subunit E